MSLVEFAERVAVNLSAFPTFAVREIPLHLLPGVFLADGAVANQLAFVRPELVAGEVMPANAAVFEATGANDDLDEGAGVLVELVGAFERFAVGVMLFVLLIGHLPDEVAFSDGSELRLSRLFFKLFRRRSRLDQLVLAAGEDGLLGALIMYFIFCLPPVVRFVVPFRCIHYMPNMGNNQELF